ncbi:MAG: PAS domain-containing sensor histidine kinase [Halobacteriales archaeon]|nr:PAS domain-containing sensor histidine kinase [Halobacteriales archaeon]
MATDITELKDRERHLERYETLVEVSGDPMYMLDPDGRFRYVNEALQDITGHTEDELLGEDVEVVMDAEDVERGEELIRSLLESEDRRGTFEMDLVTADGNQIPSENHISLLYEDGDFDGTVGVLRDISARLQRERQLQRERDRLDEFAGVVSHDLRNPLNVAEGRLELAAEDCDSDDLDTVARAHDRMAALIDDLLELARAGSDMGDPEPIDLADFLQNCWRNVESENATLEIETETTIKADKSRLKQLFENLFRNAVEHAGPDVTVRVGGLPNGFYVEDDGPGFDDEALDRVLEPGYSSSEGTGFGLSIVRSIAEAHGWSLTVRNGADGGARFEFTGIT